MRQPKKGVPKGYSTLIPCGWKVLSLWMYLYSLLFHIGICLTEKKEYEEAFAKFQHVLEKGQHHQGGTLNISFSFRIILVLLSCFVVEFFSQKMQSIFFDVNKNFILLARF